MNTGSFRDAYTGAGRSWQAFATSRYILPDPPRQVKGRLTAGQGQVNGKDKSEESRADVTMPGNGTNFYTGKFVQGLKTKSYKIQDKKNQNHRYLFSREVL